MKPTLLYSAEPARGWMPWGAFAPILGLLLVALPSIAAWKIESAFGLVDEKGEPLVFAGFCTLLFLDFGLIGLLLLSWVRGVERRSLATIGLVRQRPWRTFAFGWGVGLATSSLVVMAIWIAGGYAVGDAFPAWRSPGALLRIGILLAGFVVQASVEELVFRGWLLSAVARKLNLTLGVVLTSLLFMFLHYSPHQAWNLMLMTFLFSAFACAWAIWSGNIWGVMGWHSAWNWLIAVGFGVPITGLDTGLPALLVKLTPDGPIHLTGGEQGPEGSYLCTAFLAAATVWLFWRGARRRREEMARNPQI